MKLFLLSDICRSGAVCERCRDRERGAGLRAAFERHYEPPPRWECPTKPWGWTPPSRGLGDTVAKVIKAVTLGKAKECGGCAKRRAAWNKLLPY
jgi:hypothetical protein